MLPLFFLSSTTDGFTLPKQILVIATTTLISIIFCIKSIIEGKVKLKSTPFDLPLGILVLITLLSAVFAANRFDSLAAFLPLFFAVLLYFVITNTIKTERGLLVLISALTLGAVLSGIITITSYLKIYLLPFAYARTPLFNTYGSLLDEIIYLTLTLPLTGYFAYGIVNKLNKRKKNGIEMLQQDEQKNMPGVAIAFTAAFAILALTIGVIAFIFLTNQRPTILPFETGFQTAFASISQDTGKVFKSFLLGSGYGTYLTDFTRFKSPTYNQDPNLWTYTFFLSSSLILELLATTGFLGALAFILLCYKILKEKNFFLPIIMALIAAFILPFSYITIVLFIMLLGIFALIRSQEAPQRYNDIELYITTVKNEEKKYNKLLPLLFSLIIFIIIGVFNFFAARYILSDVVFQRSLLAAAQNQGIQTYNFQKQAIQIYPYRDVYYRGFAQTNLALANALANTTQSGSPSAQVQNNILLLIQQAINSGKSATTVAPETAFNWNSLSSVYRSLIGFGQDADKFSVATAVQAATLDKNNPQQYIELGGIYYQLGSYDNAISSFSTAINLKKDYANAYYNLGHALEAKGDPQDAITMYQTVKELVKKDKTNYQKISDEIKALQEKMAQKNKPQATQVNPTTTQQTLNVNKPVEQLPERKPKVNIPAPSIAPLSPTGTEKITPTNKP